jgi:alanyl-tRNA synthetase
MKPGRPTTSSEIRKAFLEFFSEVRHEIVPSSPLPQYGNPTLLFTNAGMNQFTDVFLGKEKRPYDRAATAQKVMRVQGKHNDLENVGPSPRHHTFFEMLGNFSFGDYFKREAIDYAWTFLTGVMQLEPERLWATVYLDDDEAAELWLRYLPAERILRFGKKDNFWMMGDIGPCGPNSEIHYYIGPLEEQTPEGVNNDDYENYLELWNLVFMQFEAQEDGSLTPLPRPSVDTGLGMERLVRVIQRGDSNYDTDLFMPVMDRVQALLGDTDAKRAEKYVGYRVIADHGRAGTFLIADGVRPGNTGREYVLRMIIRRAARFGRKIGFNEPFLAEVAKVFIERMGEAYPELEARRELILHTLTQEEKRFARTLDSGLQQLETLLAELHQRGERIIPGGDAFNLYQTYGLPVEITRDVAQEHGMGVNEAGYNAARAQHALASGSGAFGQYETGANLYADLLHDLVSSGQLAESGVDYDPYSGTTIESEVVGLVRDGGRVDEAMEGEMVEVVTPATPFYVEAGGEVSDTGCMMVIGQSGDEKGVEIRIDDTRRPVPGLIVHVGQVVQGTLHTGELVRLVVDNGRRRDIRRNHTATHLLHRELRAHLGKHVAQAGSLVAPDRLRFDFTHDQAVDQETLERIETAVNETILDNQSVHIRFMGQKEAVGQGAMALFGEKYGDIVRTITIGDQTGLDAYSFELCGGLHVGETGEIGLFRIVGEQAIGAGVRRIEAVTGRGAHTYVAERLDVLERLVQKLNAPPAEVESRLEAVLAENRALSRSLEQANRKLARGQFETLMAQVKQLDGFNLLMAQVDVPGADELREMADWFRDQVGSGAAVLATVNNGKPVIVATVSDDLIDRGVKAGDLAREVAKMVGGGGGGRANMAQAGGNDPAKLPAALAAVPEMVRAALRD